MTTSEKYAHKILSFFNNLISNQNVNTISSMDTLEDMQYLSHNYKHADSSVLQFGK